MKTDLRILVYPGAWSKEIAPVYFYAGGDKDVYLVIEPWDLANTPFTEAVEGIYSAILDQREGDMDFVLMNYIPALGGKDVEMFQMLEFHSDHMPTCYRKDLVTSPSLGEDMLHPEEPNVVAVCRELGEPRFTIFDRAEVESYLDGETIPSKDMLMFKDYFPNEDPEVLVNENSHLAWDQQARS